VLYLEEIKRYIGFGPADQLLLRQLHDVAASEITRVSEHFYEVLVNHEGARAVITDGPAQIARLKGTLAEWIRSGLLGPHDEAYYERRSRIGRRHVAIGLPQQYMFTAMNVMRRDLHQLIDGHMPAPRVAAHDALDRLLDMELAIMLRHYQLEAEERSVRRERHAQTEKLNAVRTLSAGLAHEVRNPLNAAKLQLELLERRLRRGDGDPRLLDAAELVRVEIGRLSKLLDEFLAFARPADLTPTPTDLVGLARHVLELERPGAALRDVELVLSGPEGGADAHVDAAKIHQVIQNLVRNAIEASPRGGKVDVVIEVIERGVALRVRDHGPGIPPDVLARIYEPFFSTKEGGTGMGMAIVHSLVTLHGGEIHVSSDGGTEFAIHLPR
jgi:two-component system sensor histidine kinase HydH